MSLVQSLNPMVIIAASLAFVGGLAWNDVVQTAIGKYIPKEGNQLTAKIIYAVLVTVAIVLIGYLLQYINQRFNEKPAV